jgi:hypothetical protein
MKPKNEKDQLCSDKCAFMNLLVLTNGDDKKVYAILKEKWEEMGKKVSAPVGRTNIKWNVKDCWMNVIASDDGTSLFLKEDAYIFRSIYATTGFTSGRHYWEIHPDSRTENEVKIGVTLET